MLGIHVFQFLGCARKMIKKTAACPSFSEAGFWTLKIARESSWVQWEPPTKAQWLLQSSFSGKGMTCLPLLAIESMNFSFRKSWASTLKNKTRVMRGPFCQKFHGWRFFMWPPALKPSGVLRFKRCGNAVDRRHSVNNDFEFLYKKNVKHEIQ